jgi:hypothetical protein
VLLACHRSGTLHRDTPTHRRAKSDENG